MEVIQTGMSRERSSDPFVLITILIPLVSILDARQPGALGHDGKNSGPGSLQDDPEDEVRQEMTACVVETGCSVQ